MFFNAAKSHIKYYIIILAAFSIFFFSCTTVRNYPAYKPFVFDANINIEAKLKTDEKKQLTDQLTQQLHDSIGVRKQKKLFFWQELRNPPVYDSSNAEKSKQFMNALLHSLGYYRDSITYDTTLRIVKNDQYRTTVNFRVYPGKLIHVDSIAYTLNDDTLQKITDNSLSQAQIKKGDAFAKTLISSELDRLADVYRNNGYMRFTRDELINIWDTVGVALLRPTLDPIEQAQQLEALRRRRENPTADLEIRLRSDIDSSRLTRYYVGNVTVYPDFTADTARYNPTTVMSGEYKFIYDQYLFKPNKLTDFIYFHRGNLYRQSNYLKTQNKFNSLSAWRLVTINQMPRANTDTVDIDMRLTPASKFAFTANLEASKNQGNILSQGEGNLIGLGLRLGLVNRNFVKAANTATTNVRYGIELNAGSGESFIQTHQFLISNTIQFPRGVPREIIPPNSRENTRTVLALNAGFTDRVDYYNISSFNASWGYEFNWRNKILSIRFPNIEYNFLTRRRLLDILIDSNASYKYIFNDGLILSTIINYKIAGGKNKKTTLANFSLETSNLVAGLINSAFLDSNIYRFIRLDAEYTQTYKIRRTAFAWRIFGGAGYEIPSAYNPNRLYLPFFREYYAGGPNSMRAWALRKLGPGSSIKSFSKGIAPDRFGDMRLELNGEYRFYLTQLFGFNLEGALFTDIGNVWFLRYNPDFPDGEFRLNKLWKDIAIGTGTGLRVDFGFLKARFDYAFKVKDPSPDDPKAQNKWFYNWKPLNGQFQLGIDYPF